MPYLIYILKITFFNSLALIRIRRKNITQTNHAVIGVMFEVLILI